MTTNVAIACQGGGTHTAFAAGALQRALPWIEAQDARLVGLSGTSGGAISAVAAWYGYRVGGAEDAVARLGDVWADVAVSGPVDAATNQWLVAGMAAQNSGLPVPGVSPYTSPSADVGRDWFLDLLERHVDFQRLPDLVGPDVPQLVVGAVDVEGGRFETFRDEAVTAETILASAAVPTVFEAVQLHGHGHWDGLFSKNPPIEALFDVDPERKPDELWVVQINPETTDATPKTLQGITDRRRELSANIGLDIQVDFVQQVNEWLESGALTGEDYKQATVRKVILDRDLALSSKLDRSSSFIEEMLAEGRETAATLLEDVAADESVDLGGGGVDADE